MFTIPIPSCEVAKFNGWVLYDGRCAMCRRWARGLGAALVRRGYVLQPLQRPWVRTRLRMDEPQLTSQMWVLTNDGELLGGADAILHLADRIWWAQPISAFARIPGGRAVMRWMYSIVAKNRSCADGVCALRTRKHQPIIDSILPLAALGGALAAGSVVPPWLWMWLIAFAIYASCKWLTWRHATDARRSAPMWMSIAYLFAWPGMNAQQFLSKPLIANRPKVGEWLNALFNVMLGAAIIWLICPLWIADEPLAAGWIGMAGFILLLHCGAFELLSLVWLSVGLNAPPIFRRPLLASSVSDFWGRRWNLAFRDLTHVYVFRPLARRFGSSGATMASFIASGIIHDIVISVPARGGYGLPTAYFTLQGAALLIERSSFGNRLNLRRGVVGRVVAILIVAAPAFWLFHPMFVSHVFVPFLRAIGAA